MQSRNPARALLPSVLSSPFGCAVREEKGGGGIGPERQQVVIRIDCEYTDVRFVYTRRSKEHDKPSLH